MSEEAKRLADFKALLEVARSLAAEKDPDNLLELIMSKATEVMDAERSSLFLYDSERDILYTHITACLVSFLRQAHKSSHAFSQFFQRAPVQPNISHLFSMY